MASNMDSIKRRFTFIISLWLRLVLSSRLYG